MLVIFSCINCRVGRVFTKSFTNFIIFKFKLREQRLSIIFLRLKIKYVVQNVKMVSRDFVYKTKCMNSDSLQVWNHNMTINIQFTSWICYFTCAAWSEVQRASWIHWCSVLNCSFSCTSLGGFTLLPSFIHSIKSGDQGAVKPPQSRHHWCPL